VSTLAAKAIEAALNRYLSLDPDGPRGLSALQGRWVALDVDGLLQVLITAEADRLRVAPAGAELEPEARITASPVTLARLGLSGEGGAAAARELRIEGDAELAHALERVLRGVEIDWEELLSRAVGDVAARQLGNLARGFGAWGRRAGDSLSADLGEYLTEEARILPSRIEVEQFLDEVDGLREDVDRLDARIARLERRRED
jgi:ubiquinone biosynthesis protein UbiJ